MGKSLKMWIIYVFLEAESRFLAGSRGMTVYDDFLRAVFRMMLLGWSGSVWEGVRGVGMFDGSKASERNWVASYGGGMASIGECDGGGEWGV